MLCAKCPPLPHNTARSLPLYLPVPLRSHLTSYLFSLPMKPPGECVLSGLFSQEGLRRCCPSAVRSRGEEVSRDEALWAILKLLCVGEERSLKIHTHQNSANSHTEGSAAHCSASGMNCLASLSGLVPRSCQSAVIGTAGAF